MVAPLTPLKRVKCSYGDCFHSFDTEDQMRVHLKNPDNHPFYCGKTPNQEKLNNGFTKCDFHGNTWEELLAHKVESMMPWVAGGRKDETPKKLNHIVCEFCGLDFSSLSGREAHRKKVHTAEQHITCKGYLHIRDYDGKIMRKECGMIFGRPSQLVYHIESGFCAYIRPQMLEDERRQKRIVKQILHDPSRFRVGNLAEPLENDYSSASGGVDLISLNDDNSSHASNHRSFTSTAFRAHKDLDNNWPGLPSSAINDLNVAAGGLSINSSRASSSIGDDSVMTSSPPHESHSNDSADDSSEAASTDRGMASSILSSPWSTGKTSTKLFGTSVPSNSVRPNWNAINDSRKRTQLEDDKSNLFYSRFWDLYDSSYNPQLFLIPDRSPPTYLCPFDGCGRCFTEVKDIGDHLRQIHAMQQKACPLCGKRFESLTQFVQHCEASSRGAKCTIARLPGYSKFLFEITGGLVSATKTGTEPGYGHKTKTITKKDGEFDEAYNSTLEQPGVRDYDYEAVAPSHPAVTRW